MHSFKYSTPNPYSVSGLDDISASVGMSCDCDVCTMGMLENVLFGKKHTRKCLKVKRQQFGNLLSHGSGEKVTSAVLAYRDRVTPQLFMQRER